MEILDLISNFMIAILVGSVIAQIVYAYALQTLATKNEMLSLGEVLAWIPVLNIYYMLCYAWNTLEEAELVDAGTEGVKELHDLLARVLESLHSADF